MVEEHKIPKISLTAVALAEQNHRANLQEIAMQTLDALGLDSALNWNIDFGAGKISRTIPEVKKNEAVVGAIPTKLAKAVEEPSGGA